MLPLNNLWVYWVVASSPELMDRAQITHVCVCVRALWTDPRDGNTGDDGLELADQVI